MVIIFITFSSFAGGSRSRSTIIYYKNDVSARVKNAMEQTSDHPRCRGVRRKPESRLAYKQPRIAAMALLRSLPTTICCSIRGREVQDFAIDLRVALSPAALSAVAVPIRRPVDSSRSRNHIGADDSPPVAVCGGIAHGDG